MFNFLRTMFGLSVRNDSNESPGSVNESTISSTVSVTLPLPEDIIIYILSFLPPSDLFNQCTSVCEWKPLVNSQRLWSLKCNREGKLLPKNKPNPLPINFYRDLFFARFGENLLKNPCGEEHLKHWTTISDSENRRYGASALEGWKVENPPEGADEVPDTTCQFCFATTHFWCRKGQLIDLWTEGFAPELLTVLKPKIYVSEWYSARFDCGSEYYLDVRLLDDKTEVLDSHRFYHKENQWTGRAWNCAKHEFTEYPDSIRYIHFIHAGKDTQFWAGHYGSKMTEGRVVLEIQ